jgi:hypothetical protein
MPSRVPWQRLNFFPLPHGQGSFGPSRLFRARMLEKRYADLALYLSVVDARSTNPGSTGVFQQEKPFPNAAGACAKAAPRYCSIQVSACAFGMFSRLRTTTSETPERPSLSIGRQINLNRTRHRVYRHSPRTCSLPVKNRLQTGEIPTVQNLAGGVHTIANSAIRSNSHGSMSKCMRIETGRERASRHMI